MREASRVPRHRPGRTDQRVVREVGEDVAVDHDERRVAQQRQRVRDAAGGLERLGLRRVVQPQAEPVAIAQRRFDEGPEVRVIHDDVAHAGRGELVEMPRDERTSARGQQRLRQRIGQRAHALAATGREDHRDHRQNVYPVSETRPSMRSSSGMSCASSVYRPATPRT